MIHSISSMSVRTQCKLLGLNRTSYYYQPKGESPENLKYMRIIDEQYMRTCYFGYRKMTEWMVGQGYDVNYKRIQRLMRLMGLQGAVPGPHTSKPHPQHKIDLPIPAQGNEIQLSQPRLVDRFYLYPHAHRIHVSGCGYRLA